MGVLLTLLCTACAPHLQAPTPAVSGCELDFEETVGRVQRNYPDYARRAGRIGRSQLDALTSELRLLSRSVNSARQCDAVISRYLALMQEGHLYLAVPPDRRDVVPVPTSREPSFRSTDGGTLIVLPSLELRFKAALQDWVAAHTAELQSRDTLVIDLRGCSGGADSTYGPLLPYIMAGAVRASGIDFYSTPENLAGWQLALEEITDPQVRAQVQDIVELLRQHPNQFVSYGSNSVVNIEPVPHPPARVVAIVDQRCASSCEQFLVDTRRSRTLVTVGTRTAGVLDFSNLVPHLLPGGERRVLLIPTSRSRRLPEDPVDPDGIRPRFEIDAAKLATMSAEEVVRWLDAASRQ